MDLPEGAKFQWIKIEARSLAEHRAYLQQLEEAMRRDAGGIAPSPTPPTKPAACTCSLQKFRHHRGPHRGLVSRRVLHTCSTTTACKCSTA
jgi:hypothetical protein